MEKIYFVEKYHRNLNKRKEIQKELNDKLTEMTGVKHFPSVEEMFKAKFKERYREAENEDEKQLFDVVV